MNKHTWLPWLEATFAVVVWGGTFIATKVALREISPASVVWLRFAIGVMVLGAVVQLRRQLRLPTGRELAYFALLGFIGITFHQWLQSTGLVTSQASTTAWIVATIPVFMAVLGWIFLREKLSWAQIGGIALAGLGVLLVVSQGDLGAITRGGFGAPGDFLILISAPNWAVFSILSRKGLQRYPAAWMMFYVMLTGWLLSTLPWLAEAGMGENGQWVWQGWHTLQAAWGEFSHLSWQGWLAIGILGLLGSGLAYIAWYDALKAISAARVGVLLYIEPLVAVVVAGIVLHEPVRLAALLGGGIILFGVWLVQKMV
jgi:drug/metabolite transporter (DMT)-like permease